MSTHEEERRFTFRTCDYALANIVKQRAKAALAEAAKGYAEGGAKVKGEVCIVGYEPNGDPFATVELLLSPVAVNGSRLVLVCEHAKTSIVSPAPSFGDWETREVVSAHRIFDGEYNNGMLAMRNSQPNLGKTPNGRHQYTERIRGTGNISVCGKGIITPKRFYFCEAMIYRGWVGGPDAITWVDVINGFGTGPKPEDNESIASVPCIPDLNACLGPEKHLLRVMLVLRNGIITLRNGGFLLTVPRADNLHLDSTLLRERGGCVGQTVTMKFGDDTLIGWDILKRQEATAFFTEVTCSISSLLIIDRISPVEKGASKLHIISG